MPSDRYSFRVSTVNAGIESKRRHNDLAVRRERARARRPVSTNVSASSRVLEHPPNAVMSIAAPALTNDQLVNGDQQEVTAPATAVSAAMLVHLPNPEELRVASATASHWLVGPGNQPASEVPSSPDVGIGMKRSSRSPSPLPMEKRRKVDRSLSYGECSSEQVAESSAAAIARSTSAFMDVDMDMELVDEMPSIDSFPPPAPAMEMMDSFEDEAQSLEAAPASPRAMAAAESMLDLAWVQPVPTPLPTQDSPLFSWASPPPPPPPPPQEQQPLDPTPVPAGELEAAQALLGLQSVLPSVASPATATAPPEPAPPSPRAIEAARDLMAMPLFAPAAEVAPGNVSDSDDDSIDDSDDEDSEQDELAAVADILAELAPPVPRVVSEEAQAQRQQYLDANMPAFPYHAGMLDQIAGGYDGCVICTAEPVEGETVVRILDCHHAFCQPCIDRWLTTRVNAVCPVCRQQYFHQ